MICAENIRFRYKRHTPVLEDVSFTLDHGESLCLLGPNGAGKTTLFRCLLNLQKPQGGRIFLDGNSIIALSPKKRAKCIAYVPQSSALMFPYTVWETVLMGRVAHLRLGASPSVTDYKMAREAMERMDVFRMAERRFHELSGGEKQLTLVARALAQQTKYLALDEPTASLDYANQIRILQVIRALSQDGYAILMTSHSPDHAFLAATRALLLKDGRVFADGKPETTVTSENLSALYGTEVCVTDANAMFSAGGRNVKVCVPSMP